MTNHQIPRYIISASEASSMAESRSLTLPQLLPSLLKSAQNLARPPISNFPVGTVGLASDGRIFFGANIEFPGLPLHHSIHAEQFLITNLAAYGGGPKLLYIAVSAAPCGHCRQFLQELRGISDTQIVITDQPEQDPNYNPISSILPNPFGPFDLLDQETPLILEKHDNQLIFKDQPYDNPQNGNLSNGYSELLGKNEEIPKDDALESARGSHAHHNSSNNGDLSNGYSELFGKKEEVSKNESLGAALGSHPPYTTSNNGNLPSLSNGCSELLGKKEEEALKNEALAAARGSHAPYSGCPSGVALMDCEGKVYRGSYMESAAYNPSMMPVQAALVAYMVAGGRGYERIVAAVVVEKEAAVVRQEDTARLLLKNISPKCELRVVHCV